MASLNAHLRNVLAQSEGARYYKVDCHIHTPSSKDAQGAKRYGYNRAAAQDDRREGYPQARALAGKILDRLAEVGIQVAAFTDHNSPGYLDNGDFNTPTWYDLISETYFAKRRADPAFPEILLLPGVEITTDRIHILGIFDNQASFVSFKIASLLRSVDIREDEFGEVDGVFGTKSIWEVADAIDEAGGICIPAHINADTSRSLLRQYAPPDMEIERLVQHHAIHVFGLVPTQSSWPDRRSYQSIMENMKIKAPGGLSYHDWMVGRRSQVPQHLPALGYMMDSDAHQVDKIGARYSWVKLDDLSFRSLTGALRNPYYCVASNHVQPDPRVKTRVLGVSVEGGFADGLVMRFNPHFSCVVGKPSSEKWTVMRGIEDTLRARRLGLRIRDELERAIERIAPGLWEVMKDRKVLTKEGELRLDLGEEIREGFKTGFLEVRETPWKMFVFLLQAEGNGSHRIYAAERTLTENRGAFEDGFIYYRSEPFMGGLDAKAELPFLQITPDAFSGQVPWPGFYFGRFHLGDESDGFEGARRLLDTNLLRAMPDYPRLRKDLFRLARELDRLAAEEPPPDPAEIRKRAREVLQALGAMFDRRKAFAKDFNATEREELLRIDFHKGDWQRVLRANPAPGDIPEFTHNVRMVLHRRQFYDRLELKFFRRNRSGRGREPVQFEQLTDSQRSMMALRLLLNSSTEMAPVFIHEPENWLDNESLLEFYDLRRIRDDQLIIFTRNPTIAVLGNAEKVMILDRIATRKGQRTALVADGGLETAGVAAGVIQLLEGGKIAFQRKVLRYRTEMERDGIRVDLRRKRRGS